MCNLLLTEREGRTGEYWPEVVAVLFSVHDLDCSTLKRLNNICVQVLLTPSVPAADKIMKFII